MVTIVGLPVDPSAKSIRHAAKVAKGVVGRLEPATKAEDGVQALHADAVAPARARATNRLGPGCGSVSAWPRSSAGGRQTSALSRRARRARVVGRHRVPNARAPRPLAAATAAPTRARRRPCPPPPPPPPTPHSSAPHFLTRPSGDAGNAKRSTEAVARPIAACAQRARGGRAGGTEPGRGAGGGGRGRGPGAGAGGGGAAGGRGLRSGG